MGRKVCFALLLLVLPCGIIISTAALRSKSNSTRQDLPGDNPQAIDYSLRVPVPLNRGPEVQDGFQGEVHPLLEGNGNLTVTASWDFDRKSHFLRMAPTDIRSLFRRLEVAIPSKTYTDRDFSRFLPAKDIGRVGQLWSLDGDTVAEFLKQFHASPSMRLVAKGRRAGPDGSFAILRASSPTHLDVHFRIHAEFDVLPEAMKRKSPVPEAWLSPACFLGRLVINRSTRRVECFRLGVPTDNPFNVHVTHATGLYNSEAHDWICVERMELVGGDMRRVEGLRWADQMETTAAHDRLSRVFYRFKEINWIAFDKVQEAARTRKKPILVVVAQGALDNQTC